MGYVKRVTFDASSAVAAAEVADADKLAPYEYTRAKEYLHKAREEAANADFQAANRFGKLSYKAARQAKKLAIKRAANPKDTDWMPPESLREGNIPESGDGDKGDKDDGGEGDTGDGADTDKAEDDGDDKTSSEGDEQ